MRSTRNKLIIVLALVSVGSLGLFWAVHGQDPAPVWTPPAVLPKDEAPAPKAAEKKAPIRIGEQPLNEKPKPADPEMIIPAAAYERPRPLTPEESTPILPAGGTLKLEGEKKDDPSPQGLPSLIPGLPESKPIDQGLPPPLPTPTPMPTLMPEPTKVLIGDPPARKELPPLPPSLLNAGPPNKQADVIPSPNKLPEPQPEIKSPAVLIAPSQGTSEKIKSFVRIRPTNGSVPPPTPKNDTPPPPIPAPDGLNGNYEGHSLIDRPLVTPTGPSVVSLQMPSVTVEKRGPVSLRASEMKTYQIVIRNLGPVAAQHLRIEDAIPAGVKLLKAEPTPQMVGDKAVWTLTDLAANGQQTITMNVYVTANVQPSHHTSVTLASASQTHLAATPVRHDVPAPSASALTIRVLGPLQATVGKPVSIPIRVANTTGQPISGIKLYGRLSDGLNTPEGPNIEGPEGGMVFQAGEEKVLKMPADAVKAGRYTILVKVATPNGIEATDTAPIDIAGGASFVAQASQVKLLPGREGELHIDVTNTTGKPMQNVVVVNRLSPGLEFLAASERGLYQANGRTVHWLIHRLDEGKTQTLKLSVQGNKPGQINNVVIAKADGVPEQTSTSIITLEAVPDLNLRVTERDSPAYMGREVVYEIQVQNRGLNAEHNVQLQVQFPPGLTPKSAQGPMRHRMEGQTVLFEPITSVNAQGQLSFRVSAMAQAVGDQRVRFAVVSNQVRNPVQREISTMVYRD